MKIYIKSFFALLFISGIIFGTTGMIAVAQTTTSNVYTLSANVDPLKPVANQSFNINLGLSTMGSGVQNGIVQVQVFTSQNVKVFSKNYDNQTITKTNPISLSIPWTATSAGDYYIKFGVFTSDWSSNPFWSNKALTFNVGQAVIVPPTDPTPTSTPIVILPPTPTSTPVVITYGLNQDVIVQEAGSMSGSTNGDWWVNSGAYFSVASGIGKTSQGRLLTTDTWSKLYAASNPVDTDGGTHPQNIFRLITKSSFKNFSQEAYFKINAYNLSSSPNRNQSNGFLFFNRYVDASTLYYTGIRVDGTAVIKKKLNGTYYTLSQPKVFQGTYNITSNPNLIPTNTYLGLKSVVTDLADGSVSIKVYMDKTNSGTWTLVAQAIDTGKTQGAVIKSSASAGVRTDFMDAEFKSYKVNNI